MFYWTLFVEYLKNYAKTRLTYRMDFWLEVLSDLMFQGVNLIFILIVFQHTPSLGGWSEAEVVFVYGFFMVPSGIFGALFNIWNFSERYIVKGEMDRILTRPAYNLYQVLLENVDPPSRFGSLVGAIIMALSWTKLGLPFELLRCPDAYGVCYWRVLYLCGNLYGAHGDFFLLGCANRHTAAHV